MRLQEIIGIVREYFFLALIAVIALGIIFFLGYFIVYKKVLKGRKAFQRSGCFLWVCLLVMSSWLLA